MNDEAFNLVLADSVVEIVEVAYCCTDPGCIKSDQSQRDLSILNS